MTKPASTSEAMFPGEIELASGIYLTPAAALKPRKKEPVVDATEDELTDQQLLKKWMDVDLLEDVSYLHDEMAKLQTSLAHLDRTQRELLEYDPELQDSDIREAHQENIGVIRRRKRLVMVIESRIRSLIGPAHGGDPTSGRSRDTNMSQNRVIDENKDVDMEMKVEVDESGGLYL